MGLVLWLGRREREGKPVLLDPDLFRIKLFSFGLTAGTLQQIALGGLLIALPIYLQLDLGYNALQAGLSLAPLSLTVFGVALSKTRSLADAEDVAQETFLAAYESLDRLKDRARFGSWLYGIALNKVKLQLRRHRQRGRALASARSTGPPVPPADESAARHELRDAVMAALARLSETNRETATLFYRPRSLLVKMLLESFFLTMLLILKFLASFN